MPQRYGDDDIDDILSSIMQKKAPGITNHTNPPSQARISPTAASRHSTSVNMPKKSTERTAAAHQPKTAPTKKQSGKYKYKKKLLLIPLVVILLIAVPLVARPIAAYIMPSAPFPRELVEKTGYPLLYPGQLPAGYSIDETTISQSADKATVYAIKNKDGNHINLSLQQQPSGLNLQPVFDTMTDVKSVDLPAGTTTIGISKDKMVTAHTLTGDIWIITRTPVEGGLQASDLENMLKTLKAAN